MEEMGADVRVFDRGTESHPEGRLQTRSSSGPMMYFEYNRQISRLVKQTRSDLIYAADIDVMPGLMWGLWGKKDIPLLLDLHEWFPEVVELQHKPLKKAVWRWIESRSVHTASALMTVNHSLQRVFEDQYHREVAVVRNVPVARPTSTVSVDQRLRNKILYYQGALNEGRGLKEAIRSLHRLPGWKLWLVGTGDIGQDLERMVAELGLQRQVQFFGRRSPEELPELAGQATVGLNLLCGDSKSYFYSLANKYFDYLHDGLPAIHMDYPEYRKLITEYEVGVLVGTVSVDSIAEAVAELTRGKKQYEGFAERCDQARSMYHWERESKEFVAVLGSMISFPG